MKLEDYGLIGDTHSGALVGSNGSIDWLCVPRFDSEACFAALLGSERNGCWQIAPQEAGIGRQSYQEDTLVLETLFETDAGAVRVIDFMPMRDHGRHVVRIVEGVRGRVNMTMRLIARFDYGRTVPWVRKVPEGLLAIAGPNALILRTDVPTEGENLSTVARFPVAEGERKTFVLTWYSSNLPVPEAVDVDQELANTQKYWREWAARCDYDGEWRPAVIRSLLTLKAMTYAPTGGIMAALTTSLPEKLGGVRNWDYRFCWLRDATLTLFSLMRSGYNEEAGAWGVWLLRAVAGDAAQLQIMYGPAGERRMTEIELPHLPGYENSSPVRIGNAASEQFQLDVYGEVMGALHLARQRKIELDEADWRLQRHLVEFVAKHWREPDEGIWEIRGPRRHFTHSKMMAWVAVDRAVRAVEEFGLEGDLDLWRALRQEIHNDVCAKGFHPGRKAFTQCYDSDKLDASLLMIPLTGFLPPTDERVISTIAAIEKELLVDGFVLRYRPDDSKVDGLPPGEGVFLPCSFWLVTCLHMTGRKQEAREMFERLLSLRTPLGLLSEEYDCTEHRLVGNFPQAFSHVSLVNTAHRLSGTGGTAVPATRG
jgi:GH15 family glucan-1,4-alpha-glucosidase